MPHSKTITIFQLPKSASICAICGSKTPIRDNRQNLEDPAAAVVRIKNLQNNHLRQTVLLIKLSGT
jgi:hypothetical protein